MNAATCTVQLPSGDLVPAVPCECGGACTECDDRGMRPASLCEWCHTAVVTPVRNEVGVHCSDACAEDHRNHISASTAGSFGRWD